jgi:tRNA nucleotidyltransferase (CCA-adding enzyme)
MWEHFEHQADMGVRGVGSTRNEAFEQAALALTAVVVPPETVEARESVRVTCTGDDEQLLLLDWLAAVVYQMSAHRMVFGGFAVRIDDSRLDAELFGEPIDLRRHQPGVEVKAATATALHVGQRPDGRWVAQCVVDV